MSFRMEKHFNTQKEYQKFLKIQRWKARFGLFYWEPIDKFTNIDSGKEVAFRKAKHFE